VEGVEQAQTSPGIGFDVENAHFLPGWVVPSPAIAAGMIGQAHFP
jgi:hypothetical protein